MYCTPTSSWRVSPITYLENKSISKDTGLISKTCITCIVPPASKHTPISLHVTIIIVLLSAHVYMKQYWMFMSSNSGLGLF